MPVSQGMTEIMDSFIAAIAAQIMVRSENGPNRGRLGAGTFRPRVRKILDFAIYNGNFKPALSSNPRLLRK